MFGFLCTLIFAFLLKWHGVLGTHSLISLSGVFSILKSSTNKTSSLHYPIQSGCGPCIPLSHMQSRAPRLEGGKAIFQVNQQGCHSSELFGAAEEGTALEAGSSLVMRFSSPSPPTEVWSVVLARGTCPPPCSEAGDSGLRGSPTSCSCIKSCHDSQGTSPTSSSTGPHPAMLAVLVKCLTGALPLDSTNYTVSSLTTRTMSHAPFTPSTVPDIKKILLCVAQHCPTH